MVNDSNHWYVTREWASKFMVHVESLRVLAVAGDPWAQYRLGNVYFLGVLYCSEQELIRNNEADTVKGSYWLEKAARQGFVAAVDNLVIVGVGPEAERLRILSREVDSDHQEYIQWSQDSRLPAITPAHFETVWKRAYGNGS
jgi:TPR repeat protein